MKVDVVVPYYRQAKQFDRLWLSLLANAEDIGKVVIVNDEPWQDSGGPILPDHKKLTFGVLLLDHEHTGFGLTRSINQGMAECTTDYVLVVAADGLLPTGIIKKKLAMVQEWPTLVSGPCHHVVPHSDPDAPEYIRTDGFMHLRDSPRGQGAPWLYLRGINKLVSRAGWIECGGMDERFDECDFEDYEFTMRWLANFGPSSVVWEETPVLHQGDPRTGQEPKTPYPLKSAGLLAKQLIALRHGLVMILTDHSGEWSPEFACIGERPSPATDVALPCQYPEWLQGCDIELLRCNAFHQIAYPEHWFQAFGWGPGIAPPKALELSPFKTRDLPLLEKFGYVVIGRDTVDQSVRAIRKDLV